jgi:hypothetical protein
MEYGTMLGDSFEYAKEAVWGKWMKWILLIISSIIFPLILGYVMEIYRGPKPAPELKNWGKLFIDGLKYLVASIIYMIPVLVVILVFGGLAFFSAFQQAAMSGDPDFFVNNIDALMPIIGMFFAGLFIALILGIIRMARTDRFGEAFNFSGILETIRRIGWGSYILALIVLFVVMVVLAIVLAIVMSIPMIGWIVYLFLIPLLTIFQARYMVQVYEAGGPVAPGTVQG